MAATENIMPCRYRSGASVRLLENGWKCDLSDFDRGRIVVGRWAGLIMRFGLSWSLGFPPQQCVVFTPSAAKKQSNGLPILQTNHLADEKGQMRETSLVTAHRKVTLTQTATLYNFAEHRHNSEWTIYPTLRWSHFWMTAYALLMRHTTEQKSSHAGFMHTIQMLSVH